jgi:hypothetical protein
VPKLHAKLQTVSGNASFQVCALGSDALNWSGQGGC